MILSNEPKRRFVLKRLVSVLLVFIIAVYASSCGKNDDSSEFVRGSVLNNVYISDFARIKFSPGPSWTFATDEEILLKNGLDDGSLSEEEVLERIRELATVYDMTASYRESGINVVILFDKYNNVFDEKGISGEEYAKKLKSELETKYSGSDTAVSFGTDETIAGEEYKCVEVLTKQENGEVKQLYYVRSIGTYFVSICVTVPEGVDAKAEILDKFDPFIIE